jgi:hypothetical protein
MSFHGIDGRRTEERQKETMMMLLSLSKWMIKVKKRRRTNAI